MKHLAHTVPFSPTNIIRTIREMNHQHVVSANNALMGSGVISPTNKGHAFLFDAGLIDAEGHPRDENTLSQAMKFVLRDTLWTS